MSRLEELIQQLCPDGVEYKYLGDVCSYATERIDAAEVNADNYVGVENLLPDKQGKTVASYVPSDGRWIHFRKDDILIGNIRPYLKKIWLATHDGGTNGDVLVIQIKNKNILRPQFLYYILSSDSFFNYDMQNAKGAKMPRGDKSAVLRYPIPLPPLPVQQEIVRILDSFTELTVELTVELTARKKQYEYYRDALLTFGEMVEYKEFGQIATIQRGASPRPIKNYITSDDSGVNWIKIGDVKPGAKYITETEEKITQEGAKKSRFVRENDFILSNSMSFGRPYIVKTTGCIHDGWLSISDYQEHFSADFLYHLLSSYKYQEIMKQKASFGGAVQNLNADIVRAIELPIVPLKEQHRIVSILDHFDALCNDLTSGLPAEIEARRKQYEYYRDKLLSFKKKASDSFRGE